MVQRKAPSDALGRSGRVGTDCARLARDERGQALPLLLMVMVFFLAAGVLVYQLALSTNYATVAQTAADAAALAAEQNVVHQLQTVPVSIGDQCASVDWNEVDAVAAKYAHDNGGNAIQVEQAPNAAGFGCDVIVLASTAQGLPTQSVQATKAAYAEARASTDPLASSSSASTPAATPVSYNDASTATGPRFGEPHGGKYGFFPDSGFNYSQGSEPEIAGRLDQLGISQKLRFTGVSGYLAGAAAATSLQSCGAAASVSGLGTAVTSQQLKAAGLELLPTGKSGQPEEVALSGTTSSACAVGTPAAPDQPAIGNPDVHLVPLTGGPAGPAPLPWAAGVGALGGPWVIPTAIVMCESGGRDLPPNYATASGYYQITLGTWQEFGGTHYAPQAYEAPKAIQDLIAAKIWDNGAGASRWVCAGIVGIT